MWSENSSQLDTRTQLLNVKFHMGKGPRDSGISQVFQRQKPQHIYLAQRNELTTHPEDFMD